MTNKEFVESLRMVADFYETHPEMELPAVAGFHIFTLQTPEEIAPSLRALGRVIKEYSDCLVYFNYWFGVIRLQIVALRERVCKRTVTGVRLVPKKVLPAIPEEVIPAHEEEIVVWDCSSPLLGEG